MPTLTTPKISYSIVAIDPEDGITTKHCIVYGANTKGEAEIAYLHGHFDCIATLEPQAERFYDASPSEYILSIERLEDGMPV